MLQFLSRWFGKAAAIHESPATEKRMTNVLVLYYSTYGHTEALAKAVAEGAASTGAKVSLKRVPELMSAEVAKEAGAKLE